MNEETFRSRLVKLVQKSRKALRLYSSVGKRSATRAGELADSQVQQWRDVNANLLQSLTAALETPNNKSLAAHVYTIRDRFYHDWRTAEGDLHQKHKELLNSSENADFARAANLAADLVSLKARVQALQAVHHEIQETINRSHISQPAIDLDHETEPMKAVMPDIEDESPIMRQAKVIPLRQRAR